MKTKLYVPLIVLLLVCFRFNAFAQNEEEVKIEFKLTDNSNNTTHTYKLLAISYSLSNPYYAQDESKLINNGSCSMIIEMGQEADEFLLKWISGAIKNTSGKVTMVAVMP